MRWSSLKSHFRRGACRFPPLQNSRIFFFPFDIRLTVPVMKAKTLKTGKVVNLCHKIEITYTRLPPTNRTRPDAQRLLFTRPNLQPRARSQGPLPSSLANSRSREEETDSWEASLPGLSLTEQKNIYQYSPGLN